MQNNNVTLSIVSHRHGKLVESLLRDLLGYNDIYKIIITINSGIEEIECPTEIQSKIITIRNSTPKGFSENHNYAFTEYCDSEYFCVLNPDIRIPQDPFPRLISYMNSEKCAILGPMVTDINGDVEDSARYFPKPTTLILKAIGFDITKFPLSLSSTGIIHPNWIAGMFMFIRSSWFSHNPFDEKFYLYYEDIDLCLRCWKSENSLSYIPDVFVIHDARRDSHKRISYFFLHIKSILYFFYKHYMRFPKN
jgi:N-acetylglucosaminyl-diphospho-decaprenol L-rhamnosyltransferase